MALRAIRQRHHAEPPVLDDRQVRRNRADAGFDVIMGDRLHSPTRQVFGYRHWWMGRTYEALWPLANAWSACCTLASLDDHAGVAEVLPLLLRGLPAYHPDGPAVLTGSGAVGFNSTLATTPGGGGDVYFDDNAWLGLALVRHHELVQRNELVRHHQLPGDADPLALAGRLFDFVVSGWSYDDGWAVPGGIRWKADPANRSRNTCANGPAAALAVRLHHLTGDPTLLDWAVRIYSWTRSALLGPDGLYADRISPDGDVVDTRWTYNQGTMIGAGVLLADAIGDPSYLHHARATAAAAMDHFTLDRLVDDNPQAFNAVYFRNLALLDRAVPDPSYAAVAAAYDDVMWDHRVRWTGLFPGDGSPLNRTAPMVQIDALLAGAQPHP